MDDDVDIYGDLPHFDVNDCKGCKEKIKELADAKINWEQEKDRKDSEWKLKFEKELDEKNMILKNSSSLMKTARAEIDRKDRIILDLRRELEDLKFRRSGFNRSEKRYTEPKEYKARRETTKYVTEMPITTIQILPPADQPEFENLSEDEEEDPEQKWEPERSNFTVYGERLRRKIEMEDEAERLQKEEAKVALSNSELRCTKVEQSEVSLSNPETKCTKVKEAENLEIVGMKQSVKLESDSKEISEDINEKVQIFKSETAISESGSLHSSENDEKSLYDRQKVYENFNENIVEDSEPFDHERNRRDDFRYNPHFNYEKPYNFHESRYKFDRFNCNNNERSRYPRDRSRNFDYERKSREIEFFNRNRQTYGKRSRSNYRSRSNSSGRRRDEKRSERKRGDNYRDYSERCEKIRDDGPTRDRYNYTENNRNFRDLRQKLEDRIEDEFDTRSDYDNHKNYRDSKRTEKSRSPAIKSRSSSGGRVRGGEIDKRKSRRSKSRERIASTEMRMDKERDEEKKISKDRKITCERNDHDLGSSGRNFAKDPTSRELPDEPKNPEKFRRNSAEEQTRHELPDKGAKNVGTSRRNSAKDSKKNELPVEPKSLENCRRNPPKDLPKSEFPDEKTNVEKSQMNFSKKSTNNEFSRKLTNLEKLERHFAKTLMNKELSDEPKNLKQLRRNCAKNLTNSESSSIKVEEPVRKAIEITQTIIEESNENIVAETKSTEKLLSPSEAKEKFIFMLENDSGSPVIPLTRPDVVPIGSRSFREEKIENIEKFIQDFQYNENHCILLGNDFSEEPEGENKGRFSTSSIVAALSMDGDDENVDEKSKDVENKLIEIDEGSKFVRDDSICLLSSESKNNFVDKKLNDVTVDKKSKDAVNDEKTKGDASDEKSKDFAIDDKLKDVNCKKLKDVAINKKSKEVSTDKKLKDVAIDKKSKEVSTDKKSKEVATDEKSKEVATDKKSKDVANDKKSKNVSKKSKDALIDKTAKDVTDDEKSKDVFDKKSEVTVVKKSKKDPIDKKLKDLIVDQKSGDTIVVEKSKDTIVEKKSKDTIVEKKSEDTIVEKKSENIIVEMKSEDVAILQKLEDFPIDKKSEDVPVDRKSKDTIVGKKSKNAVVDKKLEDVPIGKKLEVLIDKKSEDNVVDKKPEEPTIDKKSGDLIVGSKLANISVDRKSEGVLLDKKLENSAIDEKSNNAVILEKSEKMFVPPLPPSPQILPLPPLPPSPLSLTSLPADEELPFPEIPIVQEICPKETENEKPQTKKVVVKQMKKRPRIPCIPIVSRYSRQRHLMVLADSVGTHTIVKSDSIVNIAVIDKEKEKPNIPKLPEVEPKSDPKTTKSTNSSTLTEIQSDSFKDKPFQDTEKKPFLDNLVKPADTSDTEKSSLITAEITNSLLNADEPEMDSFSNILTSIDDKQTEEQLKTVLTTSEKNVVPENRLKEVESIEETKPEVEVKRVVQKLKNPEKISTTNKSTSSERETRLAQKILAPAAPTSESVSSIRKRTLPREKENQSKPVKHPKIMIIAKRRRPVELNDSSTATTLVSSVQHQNTVETPVKTNPVKIEARGRKLRSADK